MKKKYTRVSEQDVIDVILRTCENWQSLGLISPSNIAVLLKTSRYQVDKHIKSLKGKGIVEYDTIFIDSDYECHPPYHGYRLSSKGKEKFKDELKELSDKQIELMNKTFNHKTDRL